MRPLKPPTADMRGSAQLGDWTVPCITESATWLAHKLFGVAGGISGTQMFLALSEGCHVLIRMDNMTVVLYLNRQVWLRSHPLYRLAERVLLWVQTRFLSVRVVHILGHLNLGADLFSRQGLDPGGWWLHPQVVVSLIWQRFSRAEVDLFALNMTTHCLLWCRLWG